MSKNSGSLVVFLILWWINLKIDSADFMALNDQKQSIKDFKKKKKKVTKSVTMLTLK